MRRVAKQTSDYTNPTNYRPDSCKCHLHAIWQEHGADAVYAADAAFGTPGAPFAQPRKTGTLRAWIWACRTEPWK